MFGIFGKKKRKPITLEVVSIDESGAYFLVNEKKKHFVSHSTKNLSLGGFDFTILSMDENSVSFKLATESSN